ncbi:MAG: hypothetical protein AAFQ94_26845 [Bacteroidota bacterium]
MQDRLIYNSYMHSFLTNRYRETAYLKSLDLKELLAKMSFVVETEVGDSNILTNYSKMKYLQLEDKWFDRYEYSNEITNLFDQHTQLKVAYYYDLEMVDRDVFSHVYYWLLSFVDNNARDLLSWHLDELEKIFEFLESNVAPNELISEYKELWKTIINEIYNKDFEFTV